MVTAAAFLRRYGWVPAVLLLAVRPLAAEAPSAVPVDTESVLWKGPNGETLEFQNSSEIEDFLRTADVLSMEELGKGTTRPHKVLLEKEGRQMHAIFRTVDYYKRRWRSEQGLKMDFRDNYVYECAAYELGKLLGIHNIPPVVRREIDGKQGSLQAWVEGAISEEKRIREKILPPNPRVWMYQVQLMRVFDNLIYNDDRNQGNLLFDSDWKLWMIDSTRAFQTNPHLKDASAINYCERTVWTKLRELNREVLEERLVAPGLLTERQVDTMLKRRDQIVRLLEGFIEERGQGGVLFQF